MTDTEIRTAIAEACGWTQIKSSRDHEGMMGIKPPTRGWVDVPKYHNDLNAMHDCVKSSLPKDKMTTYHFTLYEMCGGLSNTIEATSRQRSEAFLRTLALWKE